MSIGPTPENRARLMLALIAWGKEQPAKPAFVSSPAHTELMQVIDEIFRVRPEDSAPQQVPKPPFSPSTPRSPPSFFR